MIWLRCKICGESDYVSESINPDIYMCSLCIARAAVKKITDASAAMLLRAETAEEKLALLIELFVNSSKCIFHSWCESQEASCEKCIDEYFERKLS